MEHLEIPTAELWLFNPFPTDLFTFSFEKPKLWCELAIAEKVQIENKILNGTAGLSVLSSAKHQKPRMEVWQNEDPRKSKDNLFKSWDVASKEAEKENKGSITKAFEFQTRIEQSPNRNSRVTIGPKRMSLACRGPTFTGSLPN